MSDHQNRIAALPPVRERAAERPTIHEIVAAVAALRPASIALRQGARTLDYGQLDTRARGMARGLSRHGIGAGSVVGVCLDRSIEQVVTLLAVLNAGCAFLTLDPADPPARRQALVADSGAAAVVTTADLADDFAGVLVLTDTMGWDGRADPSLPDRLPRPSGDDLAYIVYTSGSTGTPNGVEITHANLLNFVLWTNEAFDVTEADVASHAIGLTFDVAISEIWPFLAAGATITLVDESVRTSPELMRQWLLDEQVTIATIPMTMTELMLKMAWPDDSSVRLMLTGGDVLRAFPRRDLPFELVNNYGPSECTIVATYGVVPKRGQSDDDGRLPSIGRPISGAIIHILDEACQPVARGDEGEIWVGGKGVGRGYRGKPELTAARFRADPFVEDPAARMYRTGDRGRWLPSGELAFCGRIDSQTKIRGVRIELDEVALALQRHPAVGSAVVVAREDPGHDRYLAAYVLPASPVAPSAAELRAFLARILPRTYLPGAFVMLDRMPLTRNAKVDYAALPMPVMVEDGDGKPRRAPKSLTERRLATIVEGVLSVGEIAVDDDFFLLGGHSILATQVVIQSRDAFAVELTLRDLFNAPTIEGFAAVIEARIAEQVAAMSPEQLVAVLAGSAK
ncbi:MAG: non-ribosomal peptide synthetase [Sphingomonas sp.]